ncbi:hypothetical protein HD599_001845 [Conyzicola lurida]|uniref:Uncharacterized protein n=1 Tax=Conyzicola lurida TaxID=1172621 RepID=A0A841ANJ9_9MICO|nr:hypothetical protein [Conyzicola lurida]MBB5843522.1 hypothetical protein [Conyzicola lurida]
MALTDNTTRANARTAGAAAAIVAAVLVAQSVLRAIVGAISNLAAGGIAGNVQYSLNPLGEGVISFATSVVPSALGVFLAFWVLVPLTADLRIGRVVLRSLVAAAAAAVLTCLFTGVYAFGDAILRGGDFFYAVFGTVQTTFYAFISVTPLVLLVGVLVWLWLSKPAPAAAE